VATLLLENNKKQDIAHDKALDIWNVLTGKTEGTEAQQAYCLKIKKLYLDWHTAPDDYLIKHQDIIREFVLNEWMTTLQGVITRPEPAAENNRRIAKVVGLFDLGQPTALAKQLMFKGTNR
jgi:hypothetical protein